MKTLLKTGDIVLGDITIKGIEMQYEYDACDAIKLVSFGKEFVKELTEEIPQMLNTLKPVVRDFMQEAEEDSDIIRKEMFNDRKELMMIGLKLDEAEEQINSCDGEYEQTTVDVAYGMLDKAEQMYFNLRGTVATYIEDRIIELTKRIETLQ